MRLCNIILSPPLLTYIRNPCLFIRSPTSHPRCHTRCTQSRTCLPRSPPRPPTVFCTTAITDQQEPSPPPLPLLPPPGHPPRRTLPPAVRNGRWSIQVQRRWIPSVATCLRARHLRRRHRRTSTPPTPLRPSIAPPPPARKTKCKSRSSGIPQHRATSSTCTIPRSRSSMTAVDVRSVRRL